MNTYFLQVNVKTGLVFLLSLLWSYTLLSQGVTTISGSIYDRETKVPLAYVNIGFVNESVGTVTDENGKFDLRFDSRKISNNSILQISYLGYQTLKMAASSFFSQMEKDKTIYLQPEPYGLDEIVLTNELRKEVDVGSLSLEQNTIGYWFNPEALGGEIATKLSIDREKTKLHDLKFYLLRNASKGVKVRVNVYGYQDGYPSLNLLTENIYHTINSEKGIETINLEPYDIIVNNDIVVSLELIEVANGFIDFEISGSNYQSNSFTRLSHQDNWKRFPQIGLAMKLRTSYPSDRGKIIPKLRLKPKNLTIYWDSSLSMQEKERDIAKELTLLNRYLKELKAVNVRIITFSARILDQHDFYLTTGNTDGVIEYLENISYEGEASFDKILETNEFKADAALLFSSAETILAPLEQSIYLPTFTINSQKTANHADLQKASFYGDGHYIDLSELSIREGLDRMLNRYSDSRTYEEIISSDNLVNGRVISDTLIISNASIKVKNSFIETESDDEGFFSIQAEPGDVLLVNALGMVEKELEVNRSSELEINLIPNTTILEEVKLYGRAKQESITAMTPYGERNVNVIGYGVDELTKEDISPSYINYDDVIRKIPGVVITGVGERKRYSFVRNVFASSGEFTDTNPIIVVDDVIYRQADGLDKLPPIDIQTIESVRAIKSVAGTNRYGSLGAYGAIEIRTTATYQEKGGGTKEKMNSALVTGNDYSEENIPLLEDSKTKSSVTQNLEKANTLEEAQKIYKDLKQTTPITVPFILDASEYFKKWSPDYSFVILTNVAEIASENVKALRTLAYKLEEGENFAAAKLIYEHILELRPNEAQSYRDLALIYQYTGDYDKSMDLYKMMLSDEMPTIDFSGLQSLIIDELKHLLGLHKNKVNYRDLPSDWLTTEFKQDLRIVFEWNDRTAEFELQFVDPSKKFFKWAHTKFDNLERIEDEIIDGYSSEAFVIEDATAGEWLINLESLEKESSHNPDFLKMTIYQNYGTKEETKLVKVINLSELNKKVTIERLLTSKN